MSNYRRYCSVWRAPCPGGDNGEREDLVVLLKQLKKLGPLGRVRLRAEILLMDIDEGELAVLDEEREELNRIASVPKMEDSEFLLSLEVTDQLIEETEQSLQELKKAREAWEARRRTNK